MWGANGWPATYELVEISGSDGDHYFPPVKPGWYVHAQWWTQNGTLHQTLYGDGSVTTATYSLILANNETTDPAYLDALQWSKGRHGAAWPVQGMHGKGAAG